MASWMYGVGAAVVLFLAFLFGVDVGQTTINKDCRALGSFRVKGVAYDCKPRVPQVKLQVKV